MTLYSFNQAFKDIERGLVPGAGISTTCNLSVTIAECPVWYLVVFFLVISISPAFGLIYLPILPGYLVAVAWLSVVGNTKVTDSNRNNEIIIM